MTREQITRIMPTGGAKAAELASLITHWAEVYHIDTITRLRAFLAQIAYESSECTRFEENLNYTASGLLSTFPKYFDEEIAREYAKQPARIASRVYANRLGNGSEASGDGWRYRGRGLIQITGKDNYKECGEGIEKDLIDYPELLTAKGYAVQSACWWWNSHGCNQLADEIDKGNEYDAFSAITRRINGALYGNERRYRYYIKSKEVIL